MPIYLYIYTKWTLTFLLWMCKSLFIFSLLLLIYIEFLFDSSPKNNEIMADDEEWERARINTSKYFFSLFKRKFFFCFSTAVFTFSIALRGDLVWESFYFFFVCFQFQFLYMLCEWVRRRRRGKKTACFTTKNVCILFFFCR